MRPPDTPGVPAARRRKRPPSVAVPSAVSVKQLVAVIKLIVLFPSVILRILFAVLFPHGLHERKIPADTDKEVTAAQECKEFTEKLHFCDAPALNLFVEHLPYLLVYLTVRLRD